MQKGLKFSLFSLGISSVISQVVVLRELTVSFYGNEFFIGVILASWLFWVAIGSRYLGKALTYFKNQLKVLIALHFLAGVLLFLEIFLARYIKIFVGFAGETPNLVLGFFVALIAPLPICLALGLWWASAVRIFLQTAQTDKAEPVDPLTMLRIDGEQSRTINRAYLIEILGFILGGVLFSFVLTYFNEILVTIALILFNLVAVIVLLQNQKGYVSLKVATLTLVFVFIVISYSTPQLDAINNITQASRFKNQDLIAFSNSPYGKVAVTKMGTPAFAPPAGGASAGEQYNFYESGLLLGSNRETESSEELVHLTLLQHPLPQSVVLIGTGFNGALHEILKHNPVKIFYVELDQKLLYLAEKYIPQEFKNDLQNPRVEVIVSDGHHFLNQTKEKFDVIILNLPEPSSALLNRFYTKDFFEKAKAHLNQNGILATHLSFSPSAPNKNLEILNACLLKTLKAVFKQVIVLPENINLFLASQEEQLTFNPQVLQERLEQRNITAKLVSKDYLAYRLSGEKPEKVLNRLVANKESQINRDTKPIAYFYHTLFWLDHFYPSLAKLFKAVCLNLWWVFGILLIMLCLFCYKICPNGAYFVTKQKSSCLAALPIASVSCAGFSLMALEVLIIFSYQTAIGYLYFRLALLISALMAGMALGVWYGNRKINTSAAPKRSALLKLHLFLSLFCLALVIALPLLLRASPTLGLEMVFLLLAALAGFFGALVFPFANQLYIATQPALHKKTSAIYSADLLGSCLGALFTSVILIPVFGIALTLVFIIAPNLVLLIVCGKVRQSRGKP